MVIQTHGDRFHNDEALAIAQLLILHPGAYVLRTRDNIGADIRVDVGGSYDPHLGAYDHHQFQPKDFRREGGGIPYAAAGLIWRHFGRQILAALGVSAHLEERVWNLVDFDLIQPVDAEDTGTEDSRKNYFAGIDQLNPPYRASDAEYDSVFSEGVYFAGRIFRAAIHNLDAAAEAEAPILAAYTGGAILELPGKMNWERAVVDLLPSVTAVVYQKGSSEWTIRTVPLVVGSYQFRKAPPAEWYSLRNEELDAVTGIPGGTFCHGNGFIMGAKTREAAMAIASKFAS